MWKSLEETLRYSAYSTTPTTSKRTSQADSLAPGLCDTYASSTTSRATTVGEPLSISSYSLSNRPKASMVSSIPLQLDASLTPLPRVSSTITQYHLRPRAVDDFFIQWSRRARLSLTAEFHPYTNEFTFKDTVAWRFCKNLNEQDYKWDFKTGSVYVYSRKSSPDYVNNGRTPKSVHVRLSK